MEPKREPSLDQLRDAAVARVRLYGVANTSREMWVGQETLRTLLAGRQPQARSIRRIVTWYQAMRNAEDQS